ncbi:Rossmann-like domain-containing protein [Desulfofundulus sp.]|uniref:Rossmann-like domain-containing protein n=1 Tax=Desulfofundulus sp. TaxID=2282750 RepID=UPI003C794F98
MDIYDVLRQRAAELADRAGLFVLPVEVRSRVLTPQEAIGNPGRLDFPLQSGKERLVEAQFQGARGQAFTDQPGHFTGTLEEVFGLSLSDNYTRAVFVATLNSLLRHLGKITGTVHCRDEGPRRCAVELVNYLKARFGTPRVGFVGLQPALVEACAGHFPVRVLDLDPENIDQERAGVMIEDGRGDTGAMRRWADVLLVTGSTLANGTITEWLDAPCPAIFYGTTIAGAATLLGLPRFCPCST